MHLSTLTGSHVARRSPPEVTDLGVFVFRSPHLVVSLYSKGCCVNMRTSQKSLILARSLPIIIDTLGFYGSLVLTPPGSGQRRTPGFSFLGA